MDWIKDCFRGIAIGAGAILPGISSGVLCVIFGIYEKLLDSILNFFKNIKENFKFLLPIVIGGGIGVVIFSNLLNYFFSAYPIHTKSIFIGLILGTIPMLLKEVNQKEKFEKKNLCYLLIALLAGILTAIAEKYLPIKNIENFSDGYLILSGFIMAVGIVVPGVSSTIILMLLGVYSVYLQSVSGVYLPVLIPMGIGLFIGCLLWMKMTKFLLQKFYVPTFYCIIGFTLGSTLVLIPDTSNVVEVFLSILCIILGWKFSKYL